VLGISAKLVISIGQSRLGPRFIEGLQLHDDEGDPVDEDDDIGYPRVSVLIEFNLMSDLEYVVLRILEIDEADERVNRVFLRFDGDSVDEHLVEPIVPLKERRVVYPLDFLDGLLENVRGVMVNPLQAFHEKVFVYEFVQFPVGNPVIVAGVSEIVALPLQ